MIKKLKAIIVFTLVILFLIQPTCNVYGLLSLEVESSIHDEIANESILSYQVYVNQTYHSLLSKQGYRDKSEWMVPLNELAKIVDMKLLWDAKRHQITMHNFATYIDLYPNSNKVIVRGRSYLYLPHALTIKNGRSYVPIDFVSEVLLGDLTKKSSRIYITSKKTDLYTHTKVQSLADSYKPTLMKEGFYDLKSEIVYLDPSYSSILYYGKKASKETGEQTYVYPVVFDTENGNPITWEQYLTSQKKATAEKLIREIAKQEGKVSPIEKNTNPLFYLKPYLSELYLIIPYDTSIESPHIAISLDQIDD